MNKYFGFTIAEILITLGIIGVVVAITLPTLIKNHQKQEVLSQLKRAYSELNQAILFSEADNGPREYWNFTLNGEQFFKKYLAYYMTLNETSSGQLKTKVKYYQINGREYTSGGAFWYGNYIITTNSGYTLFFETFNDNRNQYIYIDTNGPYRGPNTIGKDMHAFILWRTQYGLQAANIMDYGNPITDRALLQSLCYNGDGFFCTALLVSDNWQFSKDYPW